MKMRTPGGATGRERQRHQQLGVEPVRLDLEVHLEGEVDGQLDAVGDVVGRVRVAERGADLAVRPHLGDARRADPDRAELDRPSGDGVDRTEDAVLADGLVEEVDAPLLVADRVAVGLGLALGRRALRPR